MGSIEYEYLLDGRIFTAVTTMFQNVFGMWFIAGLFFTFKLLIYFKSKNIGLGFAVSIIFLGTISSGGLLFGNGIDFIDSSAFRTIVAVAVFELAGLLYSIIWKK